MISDASPALDKKSPAVMWRQAICRDVLHLNGFGELTGTRMWTNYVAPEHDLCDVLSGRWMSFSLLTSGRLARVPAI